MKKPPFQPLGLSSFFSWIRSLAPWGEVGTRGPRVRRASPGSRNTWGVGLNSRSHRTAGRASGSSPPKQVSRELPPHFSFSAFLPRGVLGPCTRSIVHRVRSYSTGVRFLAPWNAWAVNAKHCSPERKLFHRGSTSPPPPHFSFSAFASLAPASLALRAACGRLPRERPLSGGQRFSFSTSGSSLVTTLLVITVLTIIVVAFTTSMGIERRTSQSYANLERAQLAAQAGLEELLASLDNLNLIEGYTTILETQSEDELPQTIIEILDEKGETRRIDLKSTGSDGEFSVEEVDIDLNSIIQNIEDKFRKTVTQGDPLKANAKFTTIFQSDAASVQFAYYTEDESSKINLKYHGSEYATKERRSSKYIDFIQEIAIFSTNNASDFRSYLTKNEFERLKNADLKREGFEAQNLKGILGQVFDSKQSRESKSQIFTFHDGESPLIIPRGYFAGDDKNEWKPYEDGGKPKFDINSISSNSTKPPQERVNEITSIIDKNLPEFKFRDLSFTRENKASEQIRYINRIAGSIVSYIDKSSPVISMNNEPVGRGLVPYVNKIAEKWHWKSTAGSSFNWNATFEHTIFVELWNPNDIAVSGEFTIELTTMRTLQIDGGPSAPFPVISGNASISLQPNEFKTFRITSQDHSVIVSSSTAPTGAIMVNTKSDDDDSKVWHSRFRASWNDIEYDFTPNHMQPFFVQKGPGLAKNQLTLTPTGSNRTIFGVSVQQVRETNSAWRTVGDPRQNFWNNYAWVAPSATNPDLRWNGRGTWASNSQFSQDFAEIWSTRDSVRTSPYIGTSRTASQDPHLVASPYNMDTHGNDAPFTVRGDKMETIAELGNIFDPAHLNDKGFTTAAGNPDNNFSSGGGRTLRIGRPESVYPSGSAGSNKEKPTEPWNVPGRMAIQLLDLFTAGEGPSDFFPSKKGKVNINTASQDVLTMIFYDLAMQSDKGAFFSNAPPKVTIEGAMKLADAVISNRPFYNATDLQTIIGSFDDFTLFEPSYGALIGSEWRIMDRGREELFRRCYDIFSFSSSALRVVVVGRVNGRNGVLLSKALLEALIEFRVVWGEATGYQLKPFIVYQKHL
jgi:hypothetical protein